LRRDCSRSRIQILLGNGLLLRQRSVTIYIELRPALIRLRDGDLGFGLQLLSARLLKLPLCLRQQTFTLVHHRLKRARVDLEEQLTLFYESPFLVRLLEKIPRYLRLDVGVDESVQSADPFAVYRNVPLLDFGNLHIGRRGSSRILFVRTTRGRDQQAGGQKQERWNRILHSSNFRTRGPVRETRLSAFTRPALAPSRRRSFSRIVDYAVGVFSRRTRGRSAGTAYNRLVDQFVGLWRLLPVTH
jgi:hypothetical protein